MYRKSILDLVEKIILAIKTSDTQSRYICSKYKYAMYVMQAICLHICHTTYSWNIKKILGASVSQNVQTGKLMLETSFSG